MIFIRKTIFIIFSLIVISILTIYKNVKIEVEDKKFYEEYGKFSKALNASTEEIKRQSKQKRNICHKDLYLAKGHQREHYKLISSESVLTISEEKNRSTILETLQNLQGWFDPKHPETASFTAQTAEFDFKNLFINAHNIFFSFQDGILKAQNATLAHEKKQRKYVFSDQVAFTSKLNDENLSIISEMAVVTEDPSKKEKIEFLQKVLITLGSKIQASSDSAIFQGEEIILSSFAENGLCKLLLPEQSNLEISSKTAKVLLDDKKPQEIVLESDIHLFSPNIQNKASYALADILSFNLLEQKIHLRAVHPKRVLFWQEGVKLSAPEIVISKDKTTNQELVEALGDLRLSFDMSEKKQIQEFLQRYL